MSTVKLIKGEAAINNAIKAMVALGEKHQDQIHTVLCSVFSHVREHKNTSLIDNAMTKMSAICNIKGIDVWIREFSNVRFIKDKGGYRKPEKKPLIVNLDAMMATPFWELKVNRDNNRPIMFDLEGRLVSYLNSALRNLAEHKTKQPEKEGLALVVDLAEFAKRHKVSLAGLEIPDGIKLPATVVSTAVKDAEKAEKPAANKPPTKRPTKAVTKAAAKVPATEPQQAAA